MTRSALAPALRLALVLATSLSVGWLALAPAHAADPHVLAKVDGAPITDEDVADAMHDIGPGLPQKLEGAAREKYVLDYLIDLRLVAAKAKADKLDQGADFTRQLDYYHDKLAMEALLTQVGKDAATEEATRKAYDEAAKAQPPVEEIHARHILLPTEEEAKAALARVKAGEDFAKVATELSKDPAGDGGDLGWFTKDRMVPEFADAAFKLQPGEVSEPVKSQFGWHIIKVEERRMRTFPPFEQLKDQASRYVAQKAQGDLIASLHTTAKVERFDEAGQVIPDTPPAPPADAAPAAAPDAPADAVKPKTP
jgi:peptidyl-prolyl cis-trans isomerase C